MGEEFFFSSRRRHTRWTGDWSSDVCSSDLPRPPVADADRGLAGVLEHDADGSGAAVLGALGKLARVVAAELAAGGLKIVEIGRASCRERGKSSAVPAAMENTGATQKGASSA